MTLASVLPQRSTSGPRSQSNGRRVMPDSQAKASTEAGLSKQTVSSPIRVVVRLSASKEEEDEPLTCRFNPSLPTEGSTLGHDGGGVEVNGDTLKVEIGSETTCLIPDAILESDGQDQIFQRIGLHLLQDGFAGCNGCVIAYGERYAGKSHAILGTKEELGVLPRVVNSLLRDSGTASKGSSFGISMWLSIIQIRNDQITDLLSDEITDDPSAENAPVLVQHPSLGVQLVGAVEAPILHHADFHEWLDCAAKRRAIIPGCLLAASSLSHTVYSLRLLHRQDGAKVHHSMSYLKFFDLAAAQQAPDFGSSGAWWKQSNPRSQPLTPLLMAVRELSKDASSNRTNQDCEVLFKASKITTILREPLCGNFQSCLFLSVFQRPASRQENVLTFKFAKAVQQLKTTPCSQHGLSAGALALLMDEVFWLQSRLAQNEADNAHFTKEISSMKRLIQHLQGPQGNIEEEKQLLEERRARALESRGLMSLSDTEAALEREQVTPYLMNKSDDKYIAGCLLYYLPVGKSIAIGSDQSCTFRIQGVGMVPNLCSIENIDNVRVCISQSGGSQRFLLINGEALLGTGVVQHELLNGDRLVFGRALAMRLQVPLQAAVETIDEGSEHTVYSGRPPAREELLLRKGVRELLPSQPPHADSFNNLRPFMKHSDSLSELQLYMEDLHCKLETGRSHAFFCTLQEACSLIDEANLITCEIRPEDRVHFEVEFVWDIYRGSIEDILVIRAMWYPKPAEWDATKQPAAEVVHYWSYQKFCERLVLMREAYNIFRKQGSWTGRNDTLEDPWTEPSITDVQQQFLGLVVNERRQGASVVSIANKSSVTQSLSQMRISVTGSGSKSAGRRKSTSQQAIASNSMPSLRHGMRRRSATPNNRVSGSSRSSSPRNGQRGALATNSQDSPAGSAEVSTMKGRLLRQGERELKAENAALRSEIVRQEQVIDRMQEQMEAISKVISTGVKTECVTDKTAVNNYSKVDLALAMSQQQNLQEQTTDHVTVAFVPTFLSSVATVPDASRSVQKMPNKEVTRSLPQLLTVPQKGSVSVPPAREEAPPGSPTVPSRPTMITGLASGGVSVNFPVRGATQPTLVPKTAPTPQTSLVKTWTTNAAQGSIVGAAVGHAASSQLTFGGTGSPTGSPIMSFRSVGPNLARFERSHATIGPTKAPTPSRQQATYGHPQPSQSVLAGRRIIPQQSTRVSGKPVVMVPAGTPRPSKSTL